MVLNLLPFIIEAFGFNIKIYKDIDQLYQTRKYEFYKIAKEHNLYSHPIVTEGGLLQEEYCKKALGILLIAASEDQDEELNHDLFNIFRKGWTYAYLFVENKKEIDLGVFMKNFLRKVGGLDKVSDDWLNTQLLVVYFLALNVGKTVVDNEWLSILQKTLLDRWQHYRDDEPTRISLNNAPKEWVTKVKELKKQIYNQYGRITNYTGMYSALNKRAEAMALLFDYENLSCESVFNTVKCTEKNVEEILLAYLARYDGKDIENASDFLCDSIYVRYMIKAYKEVKRRYFQNNKETLFIELEGLEKELATSNQKTSRLSALLSESQVKNEDIEKENARLKAELAEEKKNRQELNSLREFLFNMDKREDYKEIQKYDFEKLKSHKAIMVGGHEKWQSRMKELLPNFIFIPPDKLNFDINLLNGIDIVFIYPNYLSHKMYYRVMSAIKGTNSRIVYLNQQNEENVLKNIYIAFNFV